MQINTPAGLNMAYLTWSCEYDRRLMLRATQEQRVAAALRMIKELGL